MKYIKSLAAMFEGFGWTHWVSFVTILVVAAYIIITDIPLRS